MKIAYIDVKDEARDGFIRCSDAESAKLITEKSLDSISFELITGSMYLCNGRLSLSSLNYINTDTKFLTVTTNQSSVLFKSIEVFVRLNCWQSCSRSSPIHETLGHVW